MRTAAPTHRDEGPIPDRVRAQLLALGIPATKHTRDVLAGLFPREFNIDAAGLNTEDLARVLVHFAGSGLIAVSETGAATAIKKVAPGWHSCRFYRDFKQLLDLIAPYIAEGLNNGEGCLWVLPDVVTGVTACKALAPFVDDIDACLNGGQLVPRHSGFDRLPEAG
jgi:hypothetical protein